MINSISFPSVENVFISRSFLKNVFTRYWTVGWQFFSFSAFKMFHFVLAYTISNEKIVVIWIIHNFSLAAFEILYLSLVFNSFNCDGSQHRFPLIWIHGNSQSNSKNLRIEWQFPRAWHRGKWGVTNQQP